MSLFIGPMNKINISILVILIVICSFLLLYFAGFLEEKNIELGDCADIHYIARFASNGTIIESSYEDPVNKTGGSLYKVFVNPHLDLSVPSGYAGYSASKPYGFLLGLVGLAEGEHTNFSIKPENAYGVWNETALNEIFELLFNVPYYPRIQPYPYEETLRYDTMENVLLGSPSENVDVNNLEVGETLVYRNGTLPNGTQAQWTLEILDTTSQNVTIRHHVINQTRIEAVPGKTLWDTTIVLYDETYFLERGDPEIGEVFSGTDLTSGGYSHIKVVDLNETGIFMAVNMQAPSPGLVGATIQYEVQVITVYRTSQES
jgi:hypothetical protein